MSRVRWSPALLALAVAAGAAPAQGVAVNGASLSFSKNRGNKSVAVSVGTASLYGFGYGFGYGFNPYCGPYGLPPFAGTRVTVLYAPPPPLVLVPRSREPLDELPSDILPRRVPDWRREDPDRPPEPPAPLPGQNAGVFRPLDPGNRDRARQPVPPEAPPEAPPKPPEVKPAPPPTPPFPVEEPTLTDKGRAAFAAGEDGRAADHFRRAVAADPDDPLPRFLLIQTLVALGKYGAAVEAVADAVARVPQWPTLPYRPLDLYGPRAADYSAHLERLADTLAAHPDDPVLLFLSGCVLWFDGRKDEARLRFLQVAPALPAAERFLRALPPTVL